MKKQLRKWTAVLLLLIANTNYGQAPSLGTAANFVLFTGVGAVTNTGITQATGNVGSNSGSSTGFGNVNGQMHDGDGASGAAAADLLTAYGQLNSAIPTFFPAPLLGNGDTLVAGVYSITAVATLNGDLFLDAHGDSTSVFIFQIGAAFSANSLAKVKLINGAQACKVFWKIEGLVSIASGVTMRDTIVAHNAAIALNANDTLEGRALSTTGAVTTDGDLVYIPKQLGAPLLTGPAAPPLGTTANYALFSSDGPVSNSGITHATGDVGTNVGLTTGFDPLLISGMIHPIPDASTAACAADLAIVYAYLNGLPYDIQLLYPAQFGHNLVLTPHTYLLNAATALTDTLYLNAQGNPNAVFVIQINGALSTSTYANVKLINGTKASHVYWKVEGAVSVGDYSIFSGVIVANNGAILFSTGATLNGRAFTTNGALTVSAMNVVTVDPPVAGPISGDTAVCVGSSITLSRADTGGIWTASNSFAHVSDSGIVTGTSAGLDTIKYVVTNAAGSDSATYVVTVSAPLHPSIISGPSFLCVGSNVLLTDSLSGGNWSVTNNHGTISSTGPFTGVTAGNDTIFYKVANVCGRDSVKKIITLQQPLTAAAITGLSNVCTGSNIVLNDATTGGAWSATNGHATVVTGTVTGVTAGIDTIKYIVSNSCGNDTAVKSVTVNLGISAAAITGSASVCTGSNIVLNDATTGGAWSATNGHATVAAGTVTGVSAGTDTIVYIVSSTCGNDTAMKTITINQTLTAAAITGLASVCTGNNIVLSDATTGGTWSATNGNATVVAGTVTGVTAGTDTIKYIVSNTCGNDTAMKTVTINQTLTAAAITGAASVCTGSNIVLNDATTGGAWSATNGHATVVAGTVTGVTAGTDTIKYIVSNTCGNDTAMKTVTINQTLTAAAITGSASVCTGSNIVLSDATTGGAWSATNGHATVVAGTVTGVTAGTDTIKYIVGNTCGNDTAMKTVTINQTLTAAAITGSASVCTGSNIVLNDATTGGAWSATNGNATVVAGTVTGVTAGIDTIKYIVSNTCGNDTAMKIVTINSGISVAPITGLSNVCTGNNIVLTDATTGGAWSVTNGHATVVAGTVTGITAGTDTVMYIASSTCGGDTVTKIITINQIPTAAAITGLASVCTGNNIVLSDATTGGTWSATNGNATVVAGTVTGVTAGTDTIKYIVSNTCGNDTAMKTVTINQTLTAAAITGAASVCTGSNIVLNDATTGGAWSATNGHATVVAGTVTGVTAGTDTIKYIVSNTCGNDTAMKTVTINQTLTAAAITGAASVCTGSNIVLNDATTGGAWSATNGHATVVAGTVTGVTAGTDTIKYIVSNTCGNDTAMKTVTINQTLTAAAITGSASVCTGSNIVLNDATTGGAWSATNGNATVVAGTVTGVTAGIDTIKYIVSNTCGNDTAMKIVTINSGISVAPITGLSNVCTGNNIVLTDATTGGAWSVTNGHATVVAGTVTGITAGTDTVMYIASSTCGGDTVTKIITINQIPTAAAITGSASVCTGSNIVLSDATTGGAWSATNGHATVVAGTVTGVTAGTDTIKYKVGNTCGNDTAMKTVTINQTLTAAAITGLSSVCTGSNIVLNDATTGGAWSATNGHATVVAGTVTGVTAGTDTIKYIVSNTCGNDTAMKTVTINQTLTAAAITGSASVCTGSNIVLSDATTGGAWSATNGHATVVAGTVTGVTAGADTIKYIVSNTCGNDTAMKTVTINQTLTAAAITGSASVCTGSNIVLSDATTGGAWSATNGHATVVAGTVTGVTAGTDTIKYVVSNTCGNDTAMKIVTINQTLTAAAITGLASVCIGSNIVLSDATTGGAWSVKNGHASVVAGTVTGVSGGIDTVMYIVSNVCGNDTAMKAVTINVGTSITAISGPANVCIGSSIVLSDATTGGVWSASNGHATVAAGTVTGVTAGADTITYIVFGVCGNDTAIKAVSVNPATSITAIFGLPSVCTGSSIVLSDATPGGSWSATNNHATVVAGTVTGVSAGTDTIRYIVVGLCGTDTATQIVAVNPLANAGTISGLSTVCIASGISLTDPVTGGTWTVTNSMASVFAGSVTGVTAGTDTVRYTVNTVCGSDTATKVILVNPLPFAGTISGVSFVCIGTPATLTDVADLGVWVSSNATASVVGGIVTGVTSGIDTIRYRVTSACGSDSAVFAISVVPMPNAGTILGPASVCVSSTITLTDFSTGGTWSSSNASATVIAGGIVSGVTNGTDTIHYTLSNVCGANTVSRIITVNPLPVSGTITGASALCMGSSITLGGVATGGVWSSSNGNATVLAGVVTAVAAGVDTISYAVTNVCGTATTMQVVTVNAIPVLTSTLSPAAICDSALFSYTPISSVPGSLFSWTRAAVLGTGDTANSGTDLINETLHNITNNDVSVTYVYLVSANGCSSIQDVVVVVHPTPKLARLTDTACNGVGFVFTPVSLSSGVTFTWTRSAMAGVSGGMMTGSNVISDTLNNTTGAIAHVSFDITSTLQTCTFTQAVVVSLFPVVAIPVIATHAPSSLCQGTMYQNFGAATLPPSSISYAWTASNAAVWAQGAEHQYALINFVDTGATYIWITATINGTSCISKNVATVNVGTSVSSTPEVLYFYSHFICTPSTESTYQWGYDDKATLDSTILTGEINQDYLNVSPDWNSKSYWVMTTLGGCSQKTYYTTPTGVQNINAVTATMDIYPNPAGQYINVIVGSVSAGPIKYQIVDMIGQDVFTTIDASTKVVLDVATLSSGSYIINCYRDGVKLTSARFVKN